MPDREDLPYWMAFASLGGARPEVINTFLLQYGSLRSAWEAPDNELLTRLPPNRTAQAWISRRSRKDIGFYRAILETCERSSIQIVTWADDRYPHGLLDLNDPPMVLYMKGKLPLPAEDRVAVVGTRKPTEEGQMRATSLGRLLAEAGICVVSGLAVGVDAAAHRGALEGGGYTVAVLGSGLNEIYPRQHIGLAEEIAAAGLLVSEYPPMMKVREWTLRSRNRIIAALAKAAVVVEAREQSGAFITARHATAMGRRLFAMRPTDPTLPTSIGPERLIAHGATPISDVADVVGWIRRESERAQRAPQTTLVGSAIQLGGTEPADDEDRALRTVMTEIGRFLEQRGIDLRFITETKLNKWLFEVADRLDLPIKRTWYLRGCYVHSPLVTVDSLRRWHQLLPTEAAVANHDVHIMVEEVAERRNLVYTRGEIFLERFYREEAPEEYRRLYLANLHVTDFFHQISPLVQPGAVRRSQGDLGAWAQIETNLGVTVSPALAELRNALSASEEFDSIAPVFEAYTFLIEDVARWMDRATSVDIAFPESARRVASRLIQTYSENVWKLPATEIAAKMASGPRSPELRRTMTDSSQSIHQALQRLLPIVAEDWSSSIRPVERSYRGRIRDNYSSSVREG